MTVRVDSEEAFEATIVASMLASGWRRGWPDYYDPQTEKFFSDNEFAGRLTREARRAAYRMTRRRHGLPEAA